MISLKVSDYRSLIKRVDTRHDVILDHLHPISGGIRVDKNFIVMKKPNKDAVYRFLSGFNVSGRISEGGWFVGEVMEELECNVKCEGVIVVWKFNWSVNSDEWMVKEGTLSFGNVEGLTSRNIELEIEIHKRDEGNWEINYTFDANKVQTSHVKSPSRRYVVSKVFSGSLKVFEEYFWREYLDY